MEMGEAFPDLLKAGTTVERVLKKEEERFAETLEQGMKILEGCIKELGGSVIPGETVFQLYDTYGFPVDLTADVARENNLTVDHAGFETAMEAQRERARAASHFVADYSGEVEISAHCEFTGYDRLVDDSHRWWPCWRRGRSAPRLQAGEEGTVVLERTPFYAESGGQVGDRGMIRTEVRGIRGHRYPQAGR